MPVTSERKAIHAFVTHEAHDQWHDFAAEQGCTVSALIEAMAPELSLDAALAHEQYGQRLNVIVKSARKVSAARLRRKR